MFDEAYLQVFKRRGGEPVTYDQALTKGADAINQGVVLVLVLIQTEVLRVAPSLALWVLGAPAGFGGRAWYLGSWVGFTLAVCSEAWAFSCCAFVARIDEAGNALQRKIAFFESRWMYFLGYGLPPVLGVRGDARRVRGVYPLLRPTPPVRRGKRQRAAGEAARAAAPSCLCSGAVGCGAPASSARLLILLRLALTSVSLPRAASCLPPDRVLAGLSAGRPPGGDASSREKTRS
eukprot:TRINITY_DN4350_c1_g1_i3.p2 TRINITY_DN4350_c1_g1~~TRINITY_DN4350_c1_g1_i3.p2  ORF type:complete len:234 (+),score=2.68 TRINITY_DN4350_c1_g1_i3:1542-2243(+)